MKILCISDRVEQLLYEPSLNTYAAEVEAVVACGDLPFDYLEYIITFLGVPVYYILGNHYPSPDSEEYPGGCTPLDGQVLDLGGVKLAGLSEMVREERVLDVFPDRTELDLYLWIVEHRERLALEARDNAVSPEIAKDDILLKGRKKALIPRNP